MSLISERLEDRYDINLEDIDPFNGSDGYNSPFSSRSPESSSKSTPKKKTLLYIKDNKLHREFIEDYDVITFEYHVFCSNIAHDLAKRKKEENNFDNDNELIERLNEAHRIATLLQHIYKIYLDDPAEEKRLGYECNVYQALFEKNKKVEKPLEEYDSKLVRVYTGYINPWRLFSVRARRLLIATSVLTDQASAYNGIIGTIDELVRPVFLYFAWIFFIPRLTYHLCLTFKHTFAHKKMTEEEREQGAWLRFKIQWYARWPDVLNDITWLAVGILNCFVFVGPLLPIANYLSFGLQICDVVLAAARLIIDMRKYNKLKEEYVTLSDDFIKKIETHNYDVPADKEKDRRALEQVKSNIAHLNNRISYEGQTLFLATCSATSVLISLFFILPCITTSIHLAFAGGMLAVLTSLIVIPLTWYLNSKRPHLDIEHLIEKDGTIAIKPLQMSTNEVTQEDNPLNSSVNTSHTSHNDGTTTPQKQLRSPFPSSNSLSGLSKSSSVNFFGQFSPKNRSGSTSPSFTPSKHNYSNNNI